MYDIKGNKFHKGKESSPTDVTSCILKSYNEIQLIQHTSCKTLQHQSIRPVYLLHRDKQDSHTLTLTHMCVWKLVTVIIILIYILRYKSLNEVILKCSL